ncbi:zf-CCHC domain-containing protein [Tanacetum coccineum]
MAQENYVEGCSMKRPPLIDTNGFSFWKARFETCKNTKDIDLWQVIQNGDFYYEVEDSETKLMKETPYELLEDDQKKKLSKNNNAKMTLYNALLRKEYERVFMCKTAKENLSISNEETIYSGFTRFNAIVTSLKSLDPDYSRNKHVRKLLRDLPLKWRAKVKAIEEAKDLATVPLDELIGNLKVYEMILDNDGVASKTTKEKVKSLALKAKVTREQTSDDSDSNRFGKGRSNNFGNKGGESSKQKGACYNCGIEGHFASECRKPKENKAFVRGAWSDSEDGDEHQNNATCLMAINSQDVESKPSSSNNDLDIINLQKENEELLSKINDLEIEVKKLANDKEVVEPCKTCDVLTKEVTDIIGIRQNRSQNDNIVLKNGKRRKRKDNQAKSHKKSKSTTTMSKSKAEHVIVVIVMGHPVTNLLGKGSGQEINGDDHMTWALLKIDGQDCLLKALTQQAHPQELSQRKHKT